MLRRNTIDAFDPAVEPLAIDADLRALHFTHRDRYPFLLESTAKNPRLGRFDILFAAADERIVLDRRQDVAGDGTVFLDALDDAWRRERLPAYAGDLPFAGGWFLYLGYELGAEIEPGVRLRTDADLPTAFAVRCRAAIVRDNETGRSWIVAEEGAHDDAEQLRQDIATTGTAHATRSTGAQAPERIDEAAGARYIAAVEAAREHIAAGDVYQANLSREWTARFPEPPEAADVYGALAAANPAPFAGSIAWGDTSILSSSPERLLSLRDGRASTRPIAGTRPRSDDRSTDLALSGDLFADPKERAEHVMLIDLERNDLGRICRPGSVEVDEMMTLESYTHVHHIVSNVSGRLREDVTPGQAIAAVFPGGTITGCPKVRCMQIIAELEEGARGAYTGSFGYLNRDGSLDLNILIRTMVLNGTRLKFRAGAGIVADSMPDSELAETRAKAEGLLRAIAG